MATDITRRWVLTACATVAFVLPAIGQQAAPKIAPSDQLNLIIYGVPEWSRTYPVAPDGTIDFPEIGRVKVAGLTAREAEQDLTRRLAQADLLTSPQVTIDLQQALTKRVTVSGAVNAPATIQYAGELTVFEALVRAGQPTPIAGAQILVLRNDAAGSDASNGTQNTDLPPGQIEIDLRALERGDMRQNIVLRDGDIVLVPEAEQVFITGYVRVPNRYTVAPGTTVEQALALAGGISERGSNRRIEITREINGERKTLKGVKLDDLVQPGDTIRVNRSIM